MDKAPHVSWFHDPAVYSPTIAVDSSPMPGTGEKRVQTIGQPVGRARKEEAAIVAASHVTNVQ